MRATRRRNGKRMVTLLVRHNIDADEFARVLAYSLCVRATETIGDSVDVEDPDTWPKRMGRERIAGITRDLYSFKGSEPADYWADDLDSTVDEDEVWSWAQGIVARAFPEMVR